MVTCRLRLRGRSVQELRDVRLGFHGLGAEAGATSFFVGVEGPVDGMVAVRSGVQIFLLCVGKLGKNLRAGDFTPGLGELFGRREDARQIDSLGEGLRRVGQSLQLLVEAGGRGPNVLVPLEIPPLEVLERSCAALLAVSDRALVVGVVVVVADLLGQVLARRGVVGGTATLTDLVVERGLERLEGVGSLVPLQDVVRLPGVGPADEVRRLPQLLRRGVAAGEGCDVSGDQKTLVQIGVLSRPAGRQGTEQNRCRKNDPPGALDDRHGHSPSWVGLFFRGGGLGLLVERLELRHLGVTEREERRDEEAAQGHEARAGRQVDPGSADHHRDDDDDEASDDAPDETPVVVGEVGLAHLEDGEGDRGHDQEQDDDGPEAEDPPEEGCQRLEAGEHVDRLVQRVPAQADDGADDE